MRHLKKIFVLSSFLSVLFHLQCTNKMPGEKSDQSPVLAMVNGADITSDQFSRKASEIESYLNLNMDMFQERKKLLDQLIVSTLIYQDALKQKVYEDPGLRDEISSYYIRTKFKGEEVSDDEALKYYNENKKLFDRIDVAHILIAVAKKNDKASDDEAARIAGNLLVRILNGEDFAGLAKEYSTDKATAQRGGELGFIRRGMTVPEFEEAAFSLKEPGDISKVIKSRFGYHILKLVEKKAGFEAFKDPIKERLKLENQKTMFDKYIEDLKKNASIIINEEKLKEIDLLGESSLLKGSPQE